MKSSANVWVRRAGLLAISAVLAIGNLGFFLWYRSTAQDRERALETRRAQLEKDVASAEADAVRLSSQKERLGQVSSAIADFYENRVGPRRETLAPIVDELHAVLRRAGVNPGQISYSLAPVADLPLTEMDMVFSFRNDYEKFKQLLSAFETDRRWIVVREVGLSRDTDVPGGVMVRVKLATYFAGEEKSREQPEPRPAALRDRG